MITKTCPRCGWLLMDNAKECEKCQYVFEEKRSFCQQCGAPLFQPVNGGIVRFCMMCGASVQKVENKQSQ